MAGFHHMNNDFDRPVDRCELQIRVPLTLSDFKDGIFDIAGKVVSQLRYIIRLLSPDAEDAIFRAEHLESQPSPFKNDFNQVSPPIASFYEHEYVPHDPHIEQLQKKVDSP